MGFKIHFKVVPTDGATNVERKPGRLASNSNGVLTSSAGPCLVPNVTNGNVEKVTHRDVIAGAMVSHGSIMQYRCDDGFRPKLSNTTCCNNGTWLTTPVCEEGDYAIYTLLLSQLFTVVVRFLV